VITDSGTCCALADKQVNMAIDINAGKSLMFLQQYAAPFSERKDEDAVIEVF